MQRCVSWRPTFVCTCTLAKYHILENCASGCNTLVSNLSLKGGGQTFRDGDLWDKLLMLVRGIWMEADISKTVNDNVIKMWIG